MIKETTDNTNLGDYAQKGGPGRPAGSRNKFSQIKLDMLEAWIENDGKGRFAELLAGTKREFMFACKSLFALLPREPLPRDESQNGLVEYKVSWLHTCKECGKSEDTDDPLGRGMKKDD